MKAQRTPRNQKDKDPDQLDELTDAQLETLTHLLKTGKIDFVIHKTHAGHWSHDLSILVDHDELMAAIKEHEKSGQ